MVVYVFTARKQFWGMAERYCIELTCIMDPRPFYQVFQAYLRLTNLFPPLLSYEVAVLLELSLSTTVLMLRPCP